MSIANSHSANGDQQLDLSLRPKALNEYVGQQKIKNNLHVLIAAARHRKEPTEHILLSGAAGLGKTTLAHIIAQELGTALKITSGPALEKVGDVASILTNLSDHQVLFVDEAHRLNKSIEEILYPAMEDYKLDIVIGKGPSARILQLDLPHFTLIAATTRLGLLSSPLRSRFGVHFRLDLYEQNDIEQIIKRSAKILKMEINEAAVKTLAVCSRGTPRIANRLLKRVRDFAQVSNNAVINESTVRQTLKMLEIDQLGLEPIDRLILKTIMEKFNGGPVGLQAIAAALNEDEETIEDVYEPYLLQLGFLVRTARGRLASLLAYNHLEIKNPQADQNPLF